MVCYEVEALAVRLSLGKLFCRGPWVSLEQRALQRSRCCLWLCGGKCLCAALLPP